MKDTNGLVFCALLQGRRAIAVRMIDQRRGGGSIEGHFYERKAALLAKEDQIESEFEKMVKSIVRVQLKLKSI